MKRVFLLKGLDHPNYSAKVEREVEELGGAQSSVVNLMKRMLTTNVTQTAADTIASQIKTIVHSHGPDMGVQEEAIMNITQSYSLKGLDCPNCSAKIEKEVGELDGMQSSVVNLMKQTLTINVTQTAADTITSRIETVVHSHEPDVEVQEETIMSVTQSYSLKGLDCPNCSAKIEREVGGLDGMQSSVVNLMKQTLTIIVAQTTADTIASRIETAVHSHEPDVEVSEVVQESYIPEKKQEANESYNSEDRKLTVHLATDATIYAIGMALTVFAKVPLPIELAFLVVSYIVLGGDVVWQAVRSISKGRISDEHSLMSVSTIGAFVIGECPEAVAVILSYQVGEFFQSLAVEHSRKSISDLVDIHPDSAVVGRNGELITISPENVSTSEIIIVRPGEGIPLDGVALDGGSMLDTSALTEESVPRSVHKGDETLSDYMNQTGALMIKTAKAFGESTASKTIDLVENAPSQKAPTENFITTFACYYTPAVVILATFLAILPSIILGGGWTERTRREFVFLVVSCPCALVISIPLTFFGSIGTASKRGALVEGSNYLEALNNVNVIVFDKTGTLTEGVFNVMDILPANEFSKERVLEYAADAESSSNHPIAKPTLAAYGEEVNQSVISNYKKVSGYRISVMVAEEKVFAGNTKLMDTECIEHTAYENAGTKVCLAVNGQYAGCILITDEVKPDSKEAIFDLKHVGVEKTIILTGDDEKIGESIVEELQSDEYYVQLLPNQRVEKVELLDNKKRPGSKLAFVGDDVNDAPVLARAGVGITIGGLGLSAAIGTADVVLMTDRPSKLVDAIEIAEATERTIMQNIVIALGIKNVFLILGALGIAGMWEAVFGDVGVTMIAVLSAMKILEK